MNRRDIRRQVANRFFFDKFVPPDRPLVVRSSHQEQGSASDTVLLMKFDGPNKGQVFTDSSPSRHEFTAVLGDAFQDTGISTLSKKFGTSSFHVDPNEYISTPDHADWNFGSGDFTIDFWSNSSAGNGAAIAQEQDANNYWEFSIANQAQVFKLVEGGVATITMTMAETIIPGTWDHIALERVGSAFTMYFNGVKKVSGTDTTVMPDFNGPLTIGGRSGNDNFSGYLDHVRISKGVSRWKSINFNLGLNPADTYTWAMTYLYAEGESDLGPIASFTGEHVPQFDITNIPVGDPDLEIVARRIYRAASSEGKFRVIKTIYNNSVNETTFTDNIGETTFLASEIFKTSIGDLTTEEVNSWIDQKNKDIAERTRCLMKTTSMTSVVNQEAYSFPDRLLLPAGQEVSIWFDDNEIIPATTQEMDYRRPAWRTTSSGTPRFWFLEQRPDTQFHLFPKPDTTDLSIRVNYPATVNDLTSDASEMLDGQYKHRHDLIIDGVASEIHRKRGDDQAISSVRLYEQKLNEFRAEISRNRIHSDVQVFLPKQTLGTTRGQSSDDFDRKPFH